MDDKLNLPLQSDIKEILRLDRKKLPSFPQVAAKLMEASKDETASLADLSKIVETDPGISVRVLEIVNSAMYGLGRKVTTLSEAVVFLGLDEIKKLAIGMTVFEKMFKSGRSGAFDRLLFWRHCLSVAVLSQEIAREIGYANPEEAYIAGLLHDVGKIFLDLQGRKDYGEFIQTLSASSDLVIEKERSIIGIGHDDVGAFFCKLWKLPENLVLAVKYHHQPFEQIGLEPDETMLIAIVSLANFLCWTQGIGSFDFIRPPILPPEVEKTINPDKIDIIKCILNMNKEIESISEFYHFAFPTVSQLRENLLWANMRLSRANTRYYYQEDPLSPLQNAPQDRDDRADSDLGLELAKPLAKAKTIKEVLDIVMYQVGRIFQPQNWSILLKDPKTGEMVFSVVVGANKDKLLGVKLPKGEGIAGHIMKTGQALIVKDVSTDKRFSLKVDRHTGFNTRSIIGTPLKTDDKIFGVIELINRISDDPFSDKDLSLLSDIAEYAGIAIERSYYNQALTNLATKDPVTGLKNRWSFERNISNSKDVMKRYGTIFSLLLINTKTFWDSPEKGGPPVQDLLKQLTQIMSKTKRKKDEIYRYGDDTCIMMLPQTYADGAEIVAYRISNEFSKAVSDSSDIPVSVQITPHTVSAEDSDQLKILVKKSLSETKTGSGDEAIEDIETSLAPIMEEANKKKDEEAEKTDSFGKQVSLQGKFTRLKTGETGRMRVERVSLNAVGFRISKSHRIKVNDFLDIHFILDDINKSLVKRRIVIREIQGNYIHADFYNPPPYAKNLGFYLMS